MAEDRIDLSRFLNKTAMSNASSAEQERIEIPLVLENVLRYCLKDASERMEKGEAVVPFSALAVGETLFMEEHPGDDVQECFASAKRTVADARGAAAYGFCYDGYIEVGADHSKRDCLIAEGSMAEEPYGHAIGLLYTVGDDGKATFVDEPIYVGNAMNYMVTLESLTEDDEGESAEAQAETAPEGSEE